MKCLNCSQPAVYQLVERQANRVFCAKHLPWTVNLSKDLGTKIVALETKPVIAPIVEAPKVAEQPKKEKKVVEEPVVEVVEKPKEEIKEEIVVEEEK